MHHTSVTWCGRGANIVVPATNCSYMSCTWGFWASLSVGLSSWMSHWEVTSGELAAWLKRTPTFSSFDAFMLLIFNSWVWCGRLKAVKEEERWGNTPEPLSCISYSISFGFFNSQTLDSVQWNSFISSKSVLDYLFYNKYSDGIKLLMINSLFTVANLRIILDEK